MLIIPAIDLIDGRCVRLFQGRFDRSTVYGNPAAQLAAFEAAGANWAHIVDLDGAKTGARRQTALIERLARASKTNLQCGGGVRTREDVAALVGAGAARVVVGSAAVRAPQEVQTWIGEFGAERICCAFDARPDGAGGFAVSLDGWTIDGGRTLDAALAAFDGGALKHVLITDISRDGALTGPNLDLTRSMIDARRGLAVQASGGVSSLADLAALRETGAAAVIVGRALYEGHFTMEDALAG
jgi:phosphoribosylformimino-5-aminoimidazole carboxamide ribotide isomerase